MSYIRSISDLLQDKSSELFKRLEFIEKKAREVLQYAQGKFPYYTPHGFKHSENVLENLNWLLPEDLTQELNGYELFFLIVAAWLHDWGMIGQPNEKPEDIRIDHHVRTEQKLERLYANLGLTLNEARIIGRICRGHRIEDLFDEKYENTAFEKGIIIHRRFLTAALRIADEIDVTASRVPEIIYFDLNPVAKAKEEFEKQLNITGIAYPSPKEKHKLVLNAVAWDPVGVTVLTRLENKIQNELNQVKTILASGVNGKGLSLDYVELKIDTRGFMKESIEFELDKQKVLDLLIGRSLYSRKDSAIRELIQNAIDACRLRKYVDSNYDPEIVVTKNTCTFEIKDNGTGMSFQTAKKYLSKIGSSFYTSEEFKALFGGDEKFDPISRWGLGLLSCFLIASRIVIDTKKQGFEPCRFIISRIDRGWRYEKGKLETPGTIVKLYLNDMGKKIQIDKTLQHFVKIPDIPIFFQKNAQKTQFIPDWGPNMEEIVNSKAAKRFEIPLGKPDIDFEYHKLSKSYDMRYVGFKIPEGYFDKHAWICYHGIKVLLPDNWEVMFSRKTCLFLNIKENIVDIEVSRERLVDNQKLQDLIHQVFLDCYKKAVDEFQSYGSNNQIKGDQIGADLAFLNHLSTRLPASAKYFTDEEKRDFLLDRIGTLFSSQEVTTGKIGAILSQKERKKVIVLYEDLKIKSEVEYFDFIESARAIIGPNLQSGESVMVIVKANEFVGSSASAISILSKLPSVGKVERAVNLRSYLANLAKEMPTKLDTILPRECRLARFPKGLGSLVATVKEVSYSEAKDPRKGFSALYPGAVRCLLFEDFPLLMKCMRNIDFAVEAVTKFKKITKGQYFIDADDAVMKIVLQHADRILASDLLQRLVKIYVCTIPCLDRTSIFSSWFILALHLLSEEVLVSHLGEVTKRGYFSRAKAKWFWLTREFPGLLLTDSLKK